MMRLKFRHTLWLGVPLLLWLAVPQKRQDEAKARSLMPQTAAAQDRLAAAAPDSQKRLDADVAAVSGLQNTQINGVARADANGELVIDQDLRRLFDYFLTMTGRYPEDAIKDKVVRYLKLHLEGKALESALNLLERYEAYTKEAAMLAVDSGADETSSSLGDIVDSRQELRRSYLGEGAAEAFFADLEIYEDDQLERLRIGLDQSLTPEQRQAELADLDAALPEAERKRRQDTFQFTALKHTLATLTDPHEALALVREQYGDAAASRYAETLKKEDAWHDKVAAYLVEKGRLTAAHAPDKEQQLAAYISRHFHGTESRRLKALVSDDP